MLSLNFTPSKKVRSEHTPGALVRCLALGHFSHGYIVLFTLTTKPLTFQSQTCRFNIYSMVCSCYVTSWSFTPAFPPLASCSFPQSQKQTCLLPCHSTYHTQHCTTQLVPPSLEEHLHSSAWTTRRTPTLTRGEHSRSTQKAHTTNPGPRAALMLLVTVNPLL